MDLEQFESQVREAIDQALNQLQAATLLSAQLETQISETGRSVQDLSRSIETFITEQRQRSPRSEDPQTSE
jgi:hypothetical protein